MNKLSDKIKAIHNLIESSEYLLIGAGAGLSTAAGIEYSGKRFEDNFKDYIEKYNLTDMYTASFYPFKTEEEKWAYWANHIYLNNTGITSNKLHKELYELLEDKNYFIISTNVDDLFTKSGFPSSKIFTTQGSYSLLQCAKPCHNGLYDNTEMVNEMLKNIDDNLKIPTELVPKCPRCGGRMEVNLRKDDTFVEDEYWHKQNNAYKKFINNAKYEKTTLLEFGVGFNTPGIIRFPFEQYVSQIEPWQLVRFNKSDINLYVDIKNKYWPVTEDIQEFVEGLLELKKQ